MKKNNSTCCLIFTKNPVPGNTKTRLIPALGVTGAYNLHRQLIKHTLSLISKISNIDFQLYHTDYGDKKWLMSVAKDYNCPTQIQVGEDLGERMYNAIHSSSNKYSHCIVIGTDCPELTEDYLLQAQQFLSSGIDAVIGPAFDGGYVLIGLNHAERILFTGVNWGKNTVLAETIDKIQFLNLQYKRLITLHDIDIEDDLQYLKKFKNINL